MIMKKRSPTGRNVPSKAQKASPAPTTDGHERAKDFLNDSEMDRLLEAAKKGRHGIRDHLLMLMMYRHGLRVSEVTALRRDDANLSQARLWVRRLKNGLSVEHPIPGDELRFIRRYLATRTDRLPWLVLSWRQGCGAASTPPTPEREPTARELPEPAELRYQSATRSTPRA